jgi:hypothetical protein
VDFSELTFVGPGAGGGDVREQWLVRLVVRGGGCVGGARGRWWWLPRRWVPGPCGAWKPV